MTDEYTEDRPKEYEWTEAAMKEMRKRLAVKPGTFLVAYCLYVFDPETKGIDVSANFIGDGHRELDAETAEQIRKVNMEFTKIVQKIFGLTDHNPVEAWKNVLH